MATMGEHEHGHEDARRGGREMDATGSTPPCALRALWEGRAARRPKAEHGPGVGSPLFSPSPSPSPSPSRLRTPQTSG